MRSAFRAVPIVLAVAALAGGCGSAVGAGSGDRSSSRPPHRQPGGDAVVGTGAEFAPPGTLLYLSTPGSGRAWDQLAAVRERLPKPGNEESNPLNFTIRTLVGTPLAPIPGAPGFGHEASMILASDRLPKGEDSYLSDVMYYQTIDDRSSVEQWLRSKGKSVPDGRDGDFTIWRPTDRTHIGDWAIADGMALWAANRSTLDAAVQRWQQHGPSLADDPRFRQATDGLDTRSAAMVGYTRGNLSDELSLVNFQGRSDELRGLWPALGFADSGFTIGANADGCWFRGTAHGGLYKPPPAFKPTLLDTVPAGQFAVVDTADAGALLPVFDAELRALAEEASREEGSPASHETARGLLGREVGLSDAQLSALLDGEQALWAGQSHGFAINTTDPEAAEAALRASRDSLLGGQQVDRNGSIVTAIDPREPASPTLSDDQQFRRIVIDSGLPERVSLLAYANVAGDPFSDDTGGVGGPINAVDSLLLWLRPSPDGYQYQLYLEVTAQG